DQVLLVGAGAGHQARAVVADAGRQVGDDRSHPRGVGAGVLGLLLRTLQLGRCDHLHGLRDLLRGFHASDPIAHFLEAGHPALLSQLSGGAQAKVLTKAARMSFSSASSSGVRSFLARMPSSRPAWFAWMRASSSFSKRPTSPTAMPSM